MKFKLFWAVCFSTYLCSSSSTTYNATIKSQINGLISSTSTSSSVSSNNSSLNQLPSTQSKVLIDSSIHSDQNSTEMLNGQEQRQNQFTQQGRGSPPNRFPPQYQVDFNYDPQLDSYGLPQDFSRPRQQQPNFNNNQQRNQQHQGQQFNNPYDILNGIIPNPNQNGFNARTPHKQHQQHHQQNSQNRLNQKQQPNQPQNGYPVGTNYPGLNPNQIHGNVVNQGYGVGNRPSEGFNQRTGVEPKLPESGEKNGDVDGGTPVDENVANNSQGGEEDGNEEVTSNEEAPTDESNGETNTEANDGSDASAGEESDEGDGDEKTDANESVKPTEFDDGGQEEGDAAEESANSGETAKAEDGEGQEGGQEQDPSNDPDLAQFQNFQGGNFPGDLFPPGILSQQDLNDIQKSIEEQQKKEAQKQAEEEAAAGGAENTTGNENGEGQEGVAGNADNEGGGGGVGDNVETDQPVTTPPALNPYSPDANYNEPINNQVNLLNINRAIAARNPSPGIMGRPFNPLGAQKGYPSVNRYGGRGDFGTGVQDYEYEKPKTNRDEDEDEDEIPNRLRNNSPFGRVRPVFPSSRRNPYDDDKEDEDDDDNDQRMRPPYMKNRFAHRFADRFRPRLFIRPSRYNEDIGDYGVHRANTDQHPSINYLPNSRDRINQPTINNNLQGYDQSAVDYVSDELD